MNTSSIAGVRSLVNLGRRFSAFGAAVVLASTAFVASASGQVTVDGDLTDIMAVAQGQQADPANDVCPTAKSGFDLTHVYVYYDVAADALFVGLDVLDVPPGFGFPGPGVPGDADGDNNPDTFTNFICVAQPFLEEPGVGPDEEYSLFLDTNANGMITEHNDVHVRYQGNTLQFLFADNNLPIPGATGIIKLGTAGAGGVNTAIPDSDENTATTDIEFRIDHWSQLDPINPNCFRVVARGGSLVDGVPEDFTEAVVIQLTNAHVRLSKDVTNVTAGGGPFVDLVGALRGDTVRFRIQLTNDGNVNLDPSGIMDNLPAGLTFVPGSCVGGNCNAVSQPDGSTRITFTNLGGSTRLSVGQTRTVTFDATVNSNASGCFVNRAMGGGFSPNEGLNCPPQRRVARDDATVCVPELTCTKQISLDGTTFSDSLTACRGETVFFRVVITNPSPSVDLSNVTMRDTLDAGYTNITESDPNCTVAGQTINCAFGGLAHGGSITVNYSAVIGATATGVLHNQAHVEGSFAGRTISHDCPAQVTVKIPCVTVTCLTTPPPVVDPNTQTTLNFRVRNCGDVRLDDVTLACAVDPNNPGLTIITCPTSTGPLDPNQTRDIGVVVRSSATACGQECLILTGTGDPNGLPPFCNVTSSDRCCLIVRPQISVQKQVQLVCFLDPNNPNSIALQPPAPTEQVDAPVCGLVRWTITVRNLCPNDGLRNVRLTDCLPTDLLFRDNVTPATTIGQASEGPDCTGTGSTTTTVFRIPDLAPNGAYTFTFDAIVRAASTAGLKTNTSRARGTDAVTGVDTNVVEDTARVNVLTAAATLAGAGVNPTSVCPPEQVTFTYTYTNTGLATLEPVIVGAAQLDAGLTLISQTPAAGTNVGPVAPTQTRTITVVARAENTGAASRCVRVPVTSQPDCYDPRDAENCRIDLTAQQCVTVKNPRITVQCLTTPPPVVDPNTQVTFQYRITNTGDVSFDTVSYTCTVDPNNPGLTIVTCPAASTNLAAGANVTVSMVVRASNTNCGQECAILQAEGDPNGLDPTCNVTANDRCCLIVRPSLTISKTVQLVCFTDPNDPNQIQLQPPTPTEQVDAPVCGLVRWTISVHNNCPNEGLTNVRVTDCLPNDLSFRDNVTPATTLGGGGPDCTGTGATTPIGFQLPNLAANGTYTFTFDAIVEAAATTGVKTNTARARGTGAVSGIDTPVVQDTAAVNVRTVSGSITGTGVNPANVCTPQQVTFTYSFTNNGQFALDPVRVQAPSLDAGLTLVSQTPPAGTNVGPLNPGQSVTITIVANAIAGTFPTRRCARARVIAQPDCFDPRETTERCTIDVMTEQCVNAFNPCIDVTCLTTPPPVVDPNTQTTFQYRITNCGDVAFDGVTYQCTADPNNPGLAIVTCPAATGSLPAGQSVTVNMVVRSSATLCGQQCATLTATGDPNGLDPTCNRSDNATCCLIVRPSMTVQKQVQLVCFLDPNDPNQIQLQPPTPTEQVDAAVCGLVRWTITVHNNCPNDGLRNVRVTDCLPNDLLFRDNVTPATPIGAASEGPDCTAQTGTTPTVFRIPDLAGNGTYTFTFDAIVRAAATAGIKTNTARARGTDAVTGIDTAIVEDTARVNVLTASAQLNAGGVNPTSVCPQQQVTFTYTFVNNGLATLEPIIVGAAQLDACLTLVSQNPAPGTNIGPLTAGQTRTITVVARANGTPGTSCCVTVPVTAQPDCFDPRDPTEHCRIDLTRQQCVNVFTPCITVTCLTTPPAVVDPNTQVTFQYRITNCGNVAFDGVTYVCAVDPNNPGLTIVTCPAATGSLPAGQSVTVNLVVRSSAASCGQECAVLTATGDPTGLDATCNVSQNDRCCLIVRPTMTVQKQVQLICFTDPNNPNSGTPQPSTPTEQVDAPVCGLVRWTITVHNNCPNDGLRNVRVTDCLPNDLLFRDNVTPATPIGAGSEGPDCTGTGSTTPTVFRIPDLAPNGTYTFTFDAIVRAAATAGLKTNTARARGTDSVTGIDTPVVEDTARVNVLTASAQLNAGGVNPTSVCANQQVTFTYTFVNNGLAALDPVIVGTAQLDACLTLVSQNPVPGTNIGPVAPTQTRTITIVARANGTPGTNCCVTVPVSAQPDCFDPRDATEHCRIDLTRQQCVNVLAPCITVTCLTTPPPVVDPNTQTTFQYRITNCGNVAFDGVTYACAADPNNPGLTIVTCPAATGALPAGQNVTVNLVVRSNATSCGQQCAILTATGDPTGLDPTCNVNANDRCCLIVRPSLTIQKQVQFICFTDPNNPNSGQPQPPTPTEQVNAPVCGLVRWTITVHNNCPNEGLRNVRVTDCLPNDLAFRDNVTPATPLGGGGPDCSGTGATTPIGFQLPDLAGNGTYTFTFDAIVKASATAGVKTNTARARGTGAVSGIDTVVVEDTARVNVLTASATFVGTSTNPNPICPPAQTTFTFTFTNTGTADLNPVILSRCTADAGLTIISQNPPEGTNLGPITAGGSRVVTVVARAEANGNPSRCVHCAITAQPNCFDPREQTEICRINRSADQCVTVNSAHITVECLTPETHVDPDNDFTFQFRVRNTGDVAFDGVSFICTPDPSLTVVTCPAPIGTLAAGAAITVDVTVHTAANPTVDRVCVALTAVGDARNLPPECNANATASCCLNTANIPTLGEWGMILLGAGLLLLMLRHRRAA
ncbi:MAG: DUF11 domain-containing protein [Planctomycetes bacterium]|nr:DUF11 domain-containing protein [Planctomycetota bacterium]